MLAIWPDPVPGPSGTRSGNLFLLTGTSTHPEVVRFAAVGKVGAPGTLSGLSTCTLVDVYVAFAGITVVAVCAKVQVSSNIVLQVGSVVALLVVGAEVATAPVPVTLFGIIMVTGMRRGPGCGRGAKFSQVGPTMGFSLQFVLRPSCFGLST